MKLPTLKNTLFDLTCLFSLVGIWPRFIEPNLLKTTKISLPIPNLPPSLHNLKILQLSDLHLNHTITNYLLEKIIRKSRSLKPDIIVLTGDLLCRGRLLERKRLRSFLASLEAPHGCFVILGNHDYAQWISINSKGDYDVIGQNDRILSKGIKRLFQQTKLTRQTTSQAYQPAINQELLDLLQQTPFQLLHNTTTQIPIENSFLNVCGLGEYMAGHCQPDRAFENFDSRYPGLILAHNPDSVPSLQRYPGDVILCGHTHGAQINLPFIRKRVTLMENPQYRRGLHHENKKWVYINRGIGGISPIRLFSSPELTCITLETSP